jgi:hypothetical protein
VNQPRKRWRKPSGVKTPEFRALYRHGSFDFAQDKFRRAATKDEKTPSEAELPSKPMKPAAIRESFC